MEKDIGSQLDKLSSTQLYDIACIIIFEFYPKKIAKRTYPNLKDTPAMQIKLWLLDNYDLASNYDLVVEFINFLLVNTNKN